MEQRLIYGRQYIDQHIAAADASRYTSGPDISPVTNALTDALFSVKSKSRYLVHGGRGRTDFYCVSIGILLFV